MRTLVLGGAGFIGMHLTERLVADGHRVTVVDDFSRGPRRRPVGRVARPPVRRRRLRRPEPGRGLGGAAPSLRPDLPARRRGGRPQRRGGPGPGHPGQHADRDAPAGLGHPRRPGVLQLDQRGVRRGRRRRHRAGAHRRGRPGDGHRRRLAPVLVRDQQAARRGRLHPRRPGPALRRGHRPFPQRVRAADGRGPRDPGDGAARPRRGGPVPGVGGRPVPRVLLRGRRGGGDAAGDELPGGFRGDRPHRQRQRADQHRRPGEAGAPDGRRQPGAATDAGAGRIGAPALPRPRPAAPVDRLRADGVAGGGRTTHLRLVSQLAGGGDQPGRRATVGRPSSRYDIDSTRGDRRETAGHLVRSGCRPFVAARFRARASSTTVASGSAYFSWKAMMLSKSALITPTSAHTIGASSLGASAACCLARR
ncbi:NAD-dependent epimerase/dehydratase family protein [Micromonospora sp. ATA32]|nr:NAD-dependent epimerase/dehydratase family protein [Micromonospora sp. ATA32]